MDGRVAVPLFGSRVSPRFDLCPEIWVVEIRERSIVSEAKVSADHLTLRERVDQLTLLGTTDMVCGGIDPLCLQQISDRGIRVFPNVAGEAQTALGLFLEGKIRPGLCCDSRGCFRNPRRR
jgi:predicted Fe-Mo cluster-binding NifX family protein